MNIPRYCSECRLSLLTTGNWVSIPNGLQETYGEYLKIFNENGRKTLIVQIVDLKNQCNHGFHLWCLLVHSNYCKKNHDHQKFCCPVENCAAAFDSFKNLSLIPLSEYRMQYLRIKSSWQLKDEYFVVNSYRYCKRF